MRFLDQENVEFSWKVALGGYECVPADAAAVGSPLFIIERDLPPYGCRTYFPLRETQLFRTFADVEPTPEKISRFGDAYGFLGFQMTSVPSKGPMEATFGEPIRAWTDEIAAMRRLVDLWEAAKAGDSETLGRHIRWTSAREVRYERDGRSVIIASDLHVTAPLLQRLQHNDLVQPAFWYLQRAVNAKLADSKLSSFLQWDPAYRKLSLRFAPRTLISALWIQLATAIDENPPCRRCDVCGKWFEVSPALARAHKVYCSNGCRLKVYRKRQAEARRLHAESLPLAEIAARLQTKVETVEGWIKR